MILKGLNRLAQENAFTGIYKYGQNDDFLPHQYRDAIYYGTECFCTHAELAYVEGNHERDMLLESVQAKFDKNEKSLSNALKKIESFYDRVLK